MEWLACIAKIISKNIEKLEINDKEILESLTNSANSISNASQNLEILLTELIDYSKPMSLDKKETDIEKTVLNVIKLIQPSLKPIMLTFPMKTF